MKRYHIKVHHDEGIFKIHTDAHTAGQAIQSVMNFENCPLSAIISIHEEEISVVENKEGAQNLVP